MSLPVIDREATLAAAKECTLRFTELLREIRVPAAPAIGHWSVAELACHMSHVHAAAPKMLRGEGSPIKDHRAIGPAWDELVAQDEERDLGVLAARIQDGWRETAELFAQKEWTEPVAWHGGLIGPAYVVAGVIISEALVHGLDIARAAGLEWEQNPEHARMAIFGFMPNLPEFINHKTVRKLEATYELRVRGGWWVYVTVSDGKLSISEFTHRKVDCRISVDPVSYLLVGFRRESLFAAMAKGRIFAWGRKPWLALAYGKLFDAP